MTTPRIARRSLPLTLPPWLIAWVAVPLAVLVAYPVVSDFRLFYDSAIAWREGASLYGFVVERDGFRIANLNLPHFTIALIGPLTLLGPIAAGILWLVVQWIAWIAALLRVDRLTDAPPFAIAAAAVLPATLLQLLLGQTGWLLGVLVTLAWMADRDGADTRAGLWAGCAIAFKPFLVPVLAWWAVAGRWRAAATAAATTGAIVLAGVLVVGAAPYREWWLTIDQVDWFAIKANASIWGSVMRHGLPLAVGYVVAGAVGLSAAWIAWREGVTDRSWLVALLAILISSPLGWAYYLPIVAGPLAGVWRSLPKPWFVASVICLFFPAGVVPVTVLGLLFLWAACLTVQVAPNAAASRAR